MSDERLEGDSGKVQDVSVLDPERNPSTAKPGGKGLFGFRSRRMKSRLILLLCILTTFWLVGCSGSPEAGNSTEANDTSVSLQADAVREGNTVVISGTTDLPDGAYITYVMRRDYGDEPWPADFYLVDGDMLVSSGKFEATLSDVPEGKLEVWVAFQTILETEIRQPEEIINRFGEMGEKLTGPNVTEVGDARRVEITITLD